MAIQMIPSSAKEVTELFEVIKKHGVTCSLEYNTEKSVHPLIAISSSTVNVEYFKGDPDAVLVTLGDTDFSFEIEQHSFSQDVSDCQIMISIVENDGAYAAWFNSGFIPPQGIEEARNITSVPEMDKHYGQKA